MPKQLGFAIESQYKPSFNSLKIINSYRRSNKISLNQIYFIPLTQEAPPFSGNKISRFTAQAAMISCPYKEQTPVTL